MEAQPHVSAQGSSTEDADLVVRKQCNDHVFRTQSGGCIHAEHPECGTDTQKTHTRVLLCQDIGIVCGEGEGRGFNPNPCRPWDPTPGREPGSRLLNAIPPFPAPPPAPTLDENRRGWVGVSRLQ